MKVNKHKENQNSKFHLLNKVKKIWHSILPFFITVNKHKVKSELQIPFIRWQRHNRRAARRPFFFGKSELQIPFIRIRWRKYNILFYLQSPNSTINYCKQTLKMFPFIRIWSVFITINYCKQTPKMFPFIRIWSVFITINYCKQTPKM